MVFVNRFMVCVSIFSLMFSLVFTLDACAYGEIVDVTITPDGKRVSIRTEGRVGRYSAHTLQNPTRLVLDFEDTGLSKEPAISGTLASGIDIRTARKGTSARVVMNLGNRPLPDHRITTVGNHLLVFLNNWSSPAGTAHQAAGTVQQAKEQPQAPVVQEETVLSGSKDLQIKSAEVINGQIVLKVMHRADQSRIYKIELGVDFDQLGFNTASIHPLSSFPREAGAQKPAQKNSRPGGPRKSAAPLVNN